MYKKIILGLLLLTPIISHAQPKDLKYLIGLFTEYLNIGIELIIGLAVIIFVWNIFLYFFTEKDKEKKDAGMYVLYSVIGFFIIISFWGLVNILKYTFALDTTTPTIPFLNFGGNGSGSGTPLDPTRPGNGAPLDPTGKPK